MPDPRFEAGPKFSESEIAEIERVLGRKLPEDYREFAMSYGGAFVGGAVDGSENFSVLKFFAAGHNGGILDVLDNYTDLRADSILPFARDELGNLYVSNDKHEVFFINYYGGTTTAERISDNFTDFVSRIVVDDE